MIIIAEKMGNLDSLTSYSHLFEGNENVELRVYLKQPLDQEELDQLELDLVSQSVVLNSIDQDNQVLRIRFRKISSEFGAISNSIDDIIGWQLCKKDTSSDLLLPILIGSAMILLLIGGKACPGIK